MWPPWELIGLPLWIALQVLELAGLVSGGIASTAPLPLSTPAAVVAPACVQADAHPAVAPAPDAPQCAVLAPVGADTGKQEPPVIVASAAVAPDDAETVTGTWDGTWEGAYGRGRLVLVLVQNASDLTGTVSIQGTSLFSAKPEAIRDGRIAERAVSFTVDGVAGQIDATGTVKDKAAWGTFTFRGAPYRFSVVRQ